MTGLHSLYAQSMPRLLAACLGTAILAAFLIRWTFRRNKSHLSYRSRPAAHRRPSPRR